MPCDEAARLTELRSLAVLDTEAETRIDQLTQFAASIFRVPIALVSLVDEDRQWFKSRVGIEATETPRQISFCTHAIRADAVMVVPDATADERFANNPLVTGGPQVRFYAGAPLITSRGHRIGTLCLVDKVPRSFTAEAQAQLAYLARLATQEIEASATKRRLARERKAREAIERIMEQKSQEIYEARIRAEHSSRAKSEFLANMSHELRTPLNSILGFSDLVLNKVDDPLTERQRTYLAMIRDGGERILDTVNQILQMAKLETGGMEMRCEPCSAAQIMEFVKAALGRLAEQTGVALDIALTGGDIAFDCDRAAVSQILRNLAANALKFSVPGSRAVMEALILSDGRLEIAVTDAGPGIPPDQLGLVFEPFVQGDHGLSRHVEGAGLGLPIARGLADQIGASVTLENRPEGGLRARLRLPADTAPRVVSASNEAAAFVGTGI